MPGRRKKCISWPHSSDISWVNPTEVNPQIKKKKKKDLRARASEVMPRRRKKCVSWLHSSVMSWVNPLIKKKKT
jgi:hypothetical protein